MRRFASVWPLLLAFALLPLGARAAAEDLKDSPPEADASVQLKKRYDAWIKQLQSDDFAAREEARASLRKNATALKSAKLLEGTLEHDDAEVRRTVRAMLSGRTRPPSSKRTPIEGQFDFSSIGTVASLSLKGEPLSKAFDALSNVGGRFHVPGAHGDKAISIEMEDVPYFDALASVLKLSQLELEGPFNRAGAANVVPAKQVVAGSEETPTATRGPIQVRVISVTSTKSFGVPTLPLYSLKLEVTWAPCVELRQYSPPRVVTARDKDGNTFSTEETTRRTSTIGVSRGTYRRVLDVPIRADEEVCGTTLATLELEFPMRLRHGVRSVVFRKFDSLPLRKSLEGKLLEVGASNGIVLRALDSIEHGSPGSFTAEAVAHLKTDSARESAELSMQGARGNWLPMYVTGGRSVSADGALRMPARVYRLGEGTPQALCFRWFEHVDAGVISIRLNNIALR